VHSSGRGSRTTEHPSSAHDDAELEALKAATRQRPAAGKGELDLGLPAGTSPSGPLTITSTQLSDLPVMSGPARDQRCPGSFTARTGPEPRVIADDVWRLSGAVFSRCPGAGSRHWYRLPVAIRRRAR
jgi:hypothetical protein